MNVENCKIRKGKRNMETLNEQLDKKFLECLELAEQITIAIAQQTMSVGGYDEFVIGMGTWFFCKGDDDYSRYEYERGSVTYHVDENGEEYEVCCSHDELKVMIDHIDKWDAHLYLTGNPMKISRDGTIIRSW